VWFKALDISGRGVHRPEETTFMYGIGIVFDIDELGGGFYGDRAWRIFMSRVQAKQLAGCTLREGDMQATISHQQRWFCIAVVGLDLDIGIIRQAFADCTEVRRLFICDEIGKEPLRDAGRIDSDGNFVESSWNRIQHDRCKDCHWPYAPETVPKNLPADLKRELTSPSASRETCFFCEKKKGNPDSAISVWKDRGDALSKRLITVPRCGRCELKHKVCIHLMWTLSLAYEVVLLYFVVRFSIQFWVETEEKWIAAAVLLFVASTPVMWLAIFPVVWFVENFEFPGIKPESHAGGYDRQGGS